MGNEEIKKCPYCAEEIKKEAVICRFCRYDLKTGKPAELPSSEAIQEVPKKVQARSGVMGCSCETRKLFRPKSIVVKYKGSIFRRRLWMLCPECEQERELKDEKFICSVCGKDFAIRKNIRGVFLSLYEWVTCPSCGRILQAVTNSSPLDV